MNVLVIGDEHTYGYGLPQGRLSYLGHFIRQVSRTRQSVSVEAYAHLSMSELSSTMTRLSLKDYDLILLQVDQNLLFDTLQEQHDNEPTLPCTLMGNSMSKQLPLRKRITYFAKGVLSKIWPFYGQKNLLTLLAQLRPYRHNVLLLTPLPHRTWHGSWMRQRGRDLLLTEAEEQLFSVFDTESVIKTGEEYFLSDDSIHLNDISHELLGRSLFDFYQSAPTIVTIQSIRRDE